MQAAPEEGATDLGTARNSLVCVYVCVSSVRITYANYAGAVFRPFFSFEKPGQKARSRAPRQGLKASSESGKGVQCLQEIAERIEYIIIVIFVIVRHAAPSEYRTEKEWHARRALVG